MSNTALPALPRLDVSSVTDARSLFFYAAHNGASNHISASALQQKIMPHLGCVAVMTADNGVNSGDFIFWDTVDTDTLSMWNVSTKCRFDINFNGWMQVKFQVDPYNITAPVFLETYKTTALIEKAGWYSYGASANTPGYALGDFTRPFTVGVGDYVEFKVQGTAASVTSFYGLTTKAWLRPLAFY